MILQQLQLNNQDNGYLMDKTIFSSHTFGYANSTLKEARLVLTKSASAKGPTPSTSMATKNAAAQSQDSTSGTTTPGLHQVPQTTIALRGHGSRPKFQRASAPSPISTLPTDVTPKTSVEVRKIVEKKENAQQKRDAKVKKIIGRATALQATSDPLIAIQNKNTATTSHRQTSIDSRRSSDRGESGQHISSHLKQFFKKQTSSVSPDKPEQQVLKRGPRRARQISVEVTNLPPGQAPEENEYLATSKPILSPGNPGATYGDRTGVLKAAAQDSVLTPVSVESEKLGQLQQQRASARYAAVTHGFAEKRGSLQRSKEDKNSRSRSIFSPENKPGRSQVTSSSPNRRLQHCASGSITKLHEKVIWFYKHLCEEYDSPVVHQFITETIPAAFKTMQKRQVDSEDVGLVRQGSSENLLSNLRLRQQTSNSKMPHSGVVRLYLSMFTEKNVQAVCDTLRRFQSKIKVVEVYLNNAGTAGGQATLSNQASTDKIRISSPMRSAGTGYSSKAFPRVAALFQLLKSLKSASTVSIISDTEGAIFVTEDKYPAFIASLARKDEDYLINSPKDRAFTNRKKSAPLSVIEIQGCQFRPIFFKQLSKSIEQGYSANITQLSLASCSIQDAEGSILMKALIHGRRTPNLKCVNLSKNLLGFKFGSTLIALLIDAQSMAQEETMNSVSQSHGQVDKFDSLDHFSLKKIDVEYNKLSYLVIQTVDKLLKNLCTFKEQAKIHQNFIKTSQAAGLRTQQQGSTATNFEVAANKVIIEETQETDSDDDSNSMTDSFDGKDLAKLFDEFVSKNKRQTRPTPGRRAHCRTPTSYGEHSRSGTRGAEQFKASPAKMNSLRNMHESRSIVGLRALQSDRKQGREVDSASDTDEEFASGGGSRLGSCVKSTTDQAPKRTNEPLIPIMSLSPRSKNLETAFQNLKQQILDSSSPGASPKVPLRLQSQTPTKDKEDDSVVVDNGLISRASRDSFVSATDLPSKINQNAMASQIAKKVAFPKDSAKSTLPASRGKSPRTPGSGVVVLRSETHKKQPPRPKKVNLAVLSPSKLARKDKLRQTNAEVRNFMDAKAVAARTNFRVAKKKSQQAFDNDSAHSDLASSYGHNAFKEAPKPSKFKKKKKTLKSRTPFSPEQWTLPVTGTNSMRGSIHKTWEQAEKSATRVLPSSAEHEEESLPVVETVEAVTMVVSTNLTTEAKARQVLASFKSPPLTEARVCQPRKQPSSSPERIHGSFALAKQLSHGPPAPTGALKAPLLPREEGQKIPELVRELKRGKSPGDPTNVPTSTENLKPQIKNLVTVKDMSKAEVAVVNAVPKKGHLTMNRSSSAEDLHLATPPLATERPRLVSRNGSLSSAMTDIMGGPISRPPNQTSQLLKPASGRNRNHAKVGWETVTYLATGKPPLGKQNLKKSVASASGDKSAISCFENSKSMVREREAIDEVCIGESQLEGRQGQPRDPSSPERPPPATRLLTMNVCEFGASPVPPSSTSQPPSESRLRVHMQNSSMLNQNRAKVAPVPTIAPSSIDIFEHLETGEAVRDVTMPMPGPSISLPHQEPTLERPNKSQQVGQPLQTDSLHRPQTFLPFLTQTQSWVDQTYRTSDMSESKPTNQNAPTSSIENFTQSKGQLDSAKEKAGSLQNLAQGGVVGLPDERGTDEDEPTHTHLSVPTEVDQTLLAEEFGAKTSDVGQKLSMYHGKPKRDTAKQRYGPGSQ